MHYNHVIGNRYSGVLEMRNLLCLLILILLVLVGGCGPELSKQELGTVVFEIPKISGSEGPYPMPQLQPPPAVQEGRTKP